MLVSKYAVGYEEKQAYVVTEDGNKILVKIQPYGRDFVKIYGKIEEGARLMQVTVPPKSGQNKAKNSNGAKNDNKTGFPGMTGAPGMMPAGGMNSRK